MTAPLQTLSRQLSTFRHVAGAVPNTIALRHSLQLAQRSLDRLVPSFERGPILPASAPGLVKDVSFLETIFADSNMPFDVPTTSILDTVGNTPLRQVEQDVYAKLEGVNFSGSIKDRAILCMVLKMFERGVLQRGSTLSLTTSGSAGVSLCRIQQALREDCGISFNALIVMPKAYQTKVSAQQMMTDGVHTEYGVPSEDADCQLLFLDGPFVDVMAQSKVMVAANGWQTLDQHYDENSMLAHKTTAMELLRQLPDMTDVVCSTGTGATAAGLRAFLPSEVTVHSRPSQSGEIDGLSDVNRYDNFCDPNTLQGYTNAYFDRECAIEHQEMLDTHHGLRCGMSSGATYWLARQVKADKPDAKVAFIAAS